jgi:hypothetical protein
MPKEFEVENEFANMTDEQLQQRIREPDAAVAAELGLPSGVDAAGSKPPCDYLHGIGSITAR